MNGDRLRVILCCVGLALTVSGCAHPFGNWGRPPGMGVSSPAGTSSGWGWLSWGNPPSGPENTLPKNALAVARLNERRGQMEQAERLYQEILRRSPNNPVPHHRLAVISARQGKLQEAERYFASAMGLKPDDPELLSDLGYFCYLSGRLQEAEQHMRQAVEVEPNHARYCNNLALIVGGQGRDEESYAYFSRTNSPNDALLNQAYVLAQRNEYRRAMDAYDRALTEDRSSRVAAQALIDLSKYTPQTGTSGNSSALAARGPSTDTGHQAASPDSPTPSHSPERSTAPPPSNLPPSAFSSPVLAASPQPASEPLAHASGERSVPPTGQHLPTYQSTGFSGLTEAIAHHPEIDAPAPRMSRLPSTDASHQPPTQTRRVMPLPDTGVSYRSRAYP